ncbi:MAG: hypothetical protein ACO1TH_05770, partial [Luteitalea sp.]
MVTPRLIHWTLAATASTLLTAAVWAQTRPNPNAPAPTGEAGSPRFETTSTAIVVDVVVRDRKGALLTDLTADDFEIYEDRLKHALGSFSVANRGAGIAVSAKKRDGAVRLDAPGAPAPEVPPAPEASGVMALVFDRLTSDNRSLAQRAALAGIPMSGQQQDGTAVFAIDLQVKLV